MFRQNVGITDRDIRLVLAVIFALIALFAPLGLWLIIPGVLALVMLLTAAIGFCPLYLPFGRNTCGVDTKQAAAKE